MLASQCDHGSGDYHKLASEQMEWLKKTISAQKTDNKLIWRTSYAHHPLFGVHHSDSQGMIKEFLPHGRSAKHDIYFAGHEHLLNYAQIPTAVSEDYVPIKNKEQTWWQKLQEQIGTDTDCHTNSEWFPRSDKSRRQTHNQGSHYHQVTIGGSGKTLYKICKSHATKGRFYYASNIHYGYALVHVTTSQFHVQIRGATSSSTLKGDTYKDQFLQWLNPEKYSQDEPNDTVQYELIVNRGNGEENQSNEAELSSDDEDEIFIQ